MNASARASQRHGSYLHLADDSQRMIIWSALHDACEWHHKFLTACPACRAGGTCAQHWREHQEPGNAYREIMMRLDYYGGCAAGIACPLDSPAQRAISSALPLAVAYRDGQEAAESAALVAAYRALAAILASGARPEAVI